MIVRSGGQTGVDRAALDAAIALGLQYAGWCPRGGWAEDHPTPPGLLQKYPLLTPTPSDDPRQRTAWNVRDASATLLIRRSDSRQSPGTDFTRVCAELLFEKPLHEHLLDETGADAATQRWLSSLIVANAPADFILNVAGPRESESPGIYDAALDYLAKLLQTQRV
jgi:hypothetical protein